MGQRNSLFSEAGVDRLSKGDHHSICSGISDKGPSEKRDNLPTKDTVLHT